MLTRSIVEGLYIILSLRIFSFKSIETFYSVDLHCRVRLRGAFVGW